MKESQLKLAQANKQMMMIDGQIVDRQIDRQINSFQSCKVTGITESLKEIKENLKESKQAWEYEGLELGVYATLLSLLPSVG